MFAWLGSQRFDSEVKFWRLFADVINDVGLTLELASPYFGRHFLLVILIRYHTHTHNRTLPHTHTLKSTDITLSKQTTVMPTCARDLTTRWHVLGPSARACAVSRPAQLAL